MDAKGHYQRYWTTKRSLEKFMNYERNWHLTDLFSKGQRVLDLGCGDGAVAQYLKEEIGVSVVGADISIDAIKKTRSRGVDAKLIDVEKENLPFKSNSFDSVFWGDNVEHLFDPDLTLKKIKDVLKKNGSLIISCPNMGYFRYRIYFLLHGALPDTEWTGLPPWQWSHIRFFNLDILKRFLESEGFEIKKVVGVNKRSFDRFLAKFLPSIFGMIFIIEAKKI